MTWHPRQWDELPEALQPVDAEADRLLRTRRQALAALGLVFAGALLGGWLTRTDTPR